MRRRKDIPVGIIYRASCYGAHPDALKSGQEPGTYTAVFSLQADPFLYNPGHAIDEEKPLYAHFTLEADTVVLAIRETAHPKSKIHGHLTFKDEYSVAVGEGNSPFMQRVMEALMQLRPLNNLMMYTLTGSVRRKIESLPVDESTQGKEKLLNGILEAMLGTVNELEANKRPREEKQLFLWVIEKIQLLLNVAIKTLPGEKEILYNGIFKAFSGYPAQLVTGLITDFTKNMLESSRLEKPVQNPVSAPEDNAKALLGLVRVYIQ